MSEENHVNFNDLIKLTIDDGAVRLKHLQLLFKILVKQLNLDDVLVAIEDRNLLSHADNLQVLKNSDGSLLVTSDKKLESQVDRVVKVIPGSQNLARNLCKDDSNPIVDMLNLLNLTKRTEALEISIQKMSSLMQTVLMNQANCEENFERLHRFEEKSREKSLSPSQLSVATECSKNHQETSSTQTTCPTVSSKSYFSEQNQTSIEEDGKKQMLDQHFIEGIVKEQVDAADQRIEKTFSTLKQTVCKIQKKVFDLQEQTDDLMFTSEQNDLKIDDTASDIKDFTSKMFCLKSDVKTLLLDSQEFKRKFVTMDEKYEAMNNVKTNKSYVDDIWRQKAFNSDLQHFILKEDFYPISDVLQLQLSLIGEKSVKMQMSLKESLACFKAEMDEKLEKNELLKFKSIMSRLFDDFLMELKVLLSTLVKNQTGVAGVNHLLPDVNCISCRSNISATKSTVSIPKLDSIAHRLKHGLDKTCATTNKSLSPVEVIKLLGAQEQRVKISNGQNDSLLNFPNSQPCFIISKDNTIVKADPMKCLNNSKYFKS